MTAVTPTIVPPPTDPVRAALIDPDRQQKLLHQAMAFLGQRHGDWHQTLRRQEAESIVSKLAVRALEKAANFDSEKGEIGAWLHGLFVNICREHHREYRKHNLNSLNEEVAGRELPEPPPDPESLLEYLSPEERTIVEGHHLQGLSFRQIADQLGIAEGAARQRLHRALKKVRQLRGEGQR